MLRRNRIITAITVAACALPASAAMAQQDQPSVVAADHPSVQGGPQDYSRATGDSASPGPGYLSADGADAAQGRGIYETERTPHTLDRDYGTPDAADAARDLPSAPSVTHAGPGPYTDSERRLVESPEVQDVVRRAISEIRETPTVTTVHVPSGGFDWGDAGIGAAGMLALFSIAGGSALMLSERRRRRSVGVATH